MLVGKTQTPEFGITPVTEPAPVRAGAQSVGSGANDGRVEWRVGRGGRRWRSPDRARQRRRRVDPHPGGVLRAAGAEAGARADLAGAGPRRSLPVDRRGAGADDRGRGGAARPDGRAGARRRDLGSAAGGAVRRAGERDPGKLRDGAGHRDAARGRDARPGVRAWRARGGEAARAARPPRRGDPLADPEWGDARRRLHRAVGGQRRRQRHARPDRHRHRADGRQHRAAVDVALRDGPEHSLARVHRRAGDQPGDRPRRRLDLGRLGPGGDAGARPAAGDPRARSIRRATTPPGRSRAPPSSPPTRRCST